MVMTQFIVVFYLYCMHITIENITLSIDVVYNIIGDIYQVFQKLGLVVNRLLNVSYHCCSVCIGTYVVEGFPLP